MLQPIEHLSQRPRWECRLMVYTSKLELRSERGWLAFIEVPFIRMEETIFEDLVGGDPSSYVLHANLMFAERINSYSFRFSSL